MGFFILYIDFVLIMNYNTLIQKRETFVGIAFSGIHIRVLFYTSPDFSLYANANAGSNPAISLFP